MGTPARGGRPKSARAKDGWRIYSPAELAALHAEIDALREVLAAQYGLTDTPTWDPLDRQQGRPRFEVTLRSDRTRRAILDTLPAEVRARRLEEAEAYGIDLDVLDEITVTLHGAMDRRTERADRSRWISEDGPMDPPSYDEWLRWQVEQHIPAGYRPVIRASADALMAAAVVAKAALDEAPKRLSAAVAAALAGGVPAKVLAEALGVSGARIYQLRDGKR